VPEPSAFEVELAIEKLKSHKSPGIDQIPAELIKVEGRKIRSEIHKHELIIVSVCKKGYKTDCSNYRVHHFCQLRTKFYPTSCYLHMQRI
jgi:hypothetical protein